MRIGGTITHHLHGAGVIKKIGEFNGHKTVTVVYKKKDTPIDILYMDNLQPIDGGQSPPSRKFAHDDWPQSTYVFEQVDVEHDLFSRWIPFTDDPSVFLQSLLDTSQKQWLNAFPFGVSTTKSPPNIGNWDKHGEYLIRPYRVFGLSVCVTVQNAESQIQSLCPYYHVGTQVRLPVQRVLVWNNGLEACVEIDWHGIYLCFYDTRFLNHRDWYCKDVEREFIVVGFAIWADIDEPEEMTVKQSPEALAKINEFMIDHGLPVEDEELHISTKGLAYWIPSAPLNNPNVFDFRGTITGVSSIEEHCYNETFLGQTGWIVEVLALRGLGDKELSIRIIVTEKIWQAKFSPEVGSDIKGTLWLQGHMIYY